MATQPRENLDFEEQRARIWVAFEEIEKISAETRKLLAEANKVSIEAYRASAEAYKIGAETKAVPYATIFQGLIAIAGLLGAGAAIAKVFFP